MCKMYNIPMNYLLSLEEDESKKNFDVNTVYQMTLNLNLVLIYY